MQGFAFSPPTVAIYGDGGGVTLEVDHQGLASFYYPDPVSMRFLGKSSRSSFQ